MDLFERLKSYDLRDLLRRRGVEVGASDFASAPWREERTPSVKIYRDHFYDFGDSEKRGDFIDWLELAEGLTPAAARKEAERVIGNTGARPPRTRRKVEASPSPRHEPWIYELVQQAHEALIKGVGSESQAVWDYLRARKLDGLVDTYTLGVVDASVSVPAAGKALARYRGRLILPTFVGGRGVWFKARAIPPNRFVESTDRGAAAKTSQGDGGELDLPREDRGEARSRYDGPPGKVPAPFNADCLDEASGLGYLVLTEGETDALSLLAAFGLGYPVMGLPGGLLPGGWAERIAQADATVYLALDPDTAGGKHAARLERTFDPLDVQTFQVALPPGGDLNDLLVSEGPESLVTKFEGWMEDARVASVSDLLYVRDRLPAELDERAERSHSVYPTALEPLDALLGGGYGEGLHLLGGITAGGKTSFALHLALSNALAGRSVLYASYEQSRLELWARIAAGMTGLPYTALKRGYYDDVDGRHPSSRALRQSPAWPELLQAAGCLQIVEGGDALSRELGQFPAETLKRRAETLLKRYGAPPLVIIDYLQRVPVPTELRLRDTRERVSYVAGQLQIGLARDIGCPVLALSSISRASYRLHEADTEARLSAFKEAGELEYTAYTALLLYSLPSDIEAQLMFSPGRLNAFVPRTLDLCKNREGETGRLAVKWAPKSGKWHGAATFPSGRGIEGRASV